MNHIDTMKQALEALEKFAKGESSGIPVTVLVNNLRLAIEQAERQEPVGKLCVFNDGESTHGWSYDISTDYDGHKRLRNLDGAPLYTAPPPHRSEDATQRQSEQEALDRMADNARELGLDYEPPQEPVAKLGPRQPLWSNLNALAKNPQAAIDAFGVEWAGRTAASAMEQLAAPPQRQPLTDEELWKFWWDRPEVPEGEDDSMEAEFVAACRRALAAHGITGESK